MQNCIIFYFYNIFKIFLSSLQFPGYTLVGVWYASANMEKIGPLNIFKYNPVYE